MSAKNAQIGFYAFSIKKSTLKRFKVRSWSWSWSLVGELLLSMSKSLGLISGTRDKTDRIKTEG